MTMTIREYAQARNVAPQMVYYYIKRGKITPHTCTCGRKVIDVEEADKVLVPRRDNV
jgi:predicted site-specific integrase-resolvase